MKIKQLFLSMSVAFSLVVSVSAQAATTLWDWGGYVPTADSPVIGGYALYQTQSCPFMGGGACTNYAGIVAFGKVAYISLGSGGVWYGGSYVATSPSYTCPSNTAVIQVTSPYLRGDGINFNPTVYSRAGIGGYLSVVPTTVTLCVKTDTY